MQRRPAGKANDQPTADLLTQRIEVREKTAWMLRSLPEEQSAARKKSALATRRRRCREALLRSCAGQPTMHGRLTGHYQQPQ